MKPRFTWSDAWVLAAVAVGGGEGGNDLKEIITAGHLVNRSVFTPQQLRRGLAKLLHEGHVRAAGQAFVVAGEASDVTARYALANRSSWELLQFFETFLDAAPYPAGDPHAEDPGWSLAEMTDERVAAATAAFEADLEDLHRDAKKEGPA